MNRASMERNKISGCWSDSSLKAMTKQNFTVIGAIDFTMVSLIVTFNSSVNIRNFYSVVPNVDIYHRCRDGFLETATSRTKSCCG